MFGEQIVPLYYTFSTVFELLSGSIGVEKSSCLSRGRNMSKLIFL